MPRLYGNKVKQFTPTPSDSTVLLIDGQTLSDLSGEGNNLTSVGDASYGNRDNPLGYGGYALECDGAGDYFTTPGTSFNFGGDDFVIQARLKLSALGSYQYIFGIQNSSGFVCGFFVTNTNKLRFDGAPENVSIVSTESLVVDTWYWLTMVRSGDTWSIYINEDRDGYDASAAGTMITVDGTAKIGARGNGIQTLSGRISHMRILTDDNGGMGGATITLPTSPYKVV